MTTDEIVAQLLQNRGLTTRGQVEQFFNPPPPSGLPTPFNSQPAIKLIQKHIQKQNKIAVFGDYDVDGICATAILWETLYHSYPHVFPHIPHRENEGYGLSIKGIDHCLSQGAKLIIAVDNGIVAFDQIDYCKSKDCDIIVIDHHEPSDKLPTPNVLLHSTSACAAGLTWFFCRDLPKPYTLHPNTLELVAIATICDLVSLLETNRSFAKHGLVELNRTHRPGLLALFAEAHLSKPYTLNPYHVGFTVGPRLNAMGRLEHAIDSLRLLCTSNLARAKELAKLLNATNQQRQTETDLSITHAMNQVTNNQLTGILLSADTSYHPGIIGLIAARLVETYWRPSIVVAISDGQSKGSARSIPGFHITEFFRQHAKLFIDLGGHAMACGFTIPTAKIDDLSRLLASAKIDKKLLVKQQRVDLEIPLTLVNLDLYSKLRLFEPYGLGNPTPVFQSTGQISDIKTVGRENKHLKFKVDGLDAIWFNATHPLNPIPYTLSYSVEKDTWNGQSKLQLIVKDAKV